MYKSFKLILICYMCIVFFILIDRSENTKISKRYLTFRNVSRFFFRINFKANMVPWNQIFVQVLGFRMNWDEPPDTFRPFHRLSRRSFYSSIEELLDRNGFSGFHCVRRAICESNVISEPNEVYFKILKMVFRKQSFGTDKWNNHTLEDCNQSIAICPFSVLEVSPYTDL